MLQKDAPVQFGGGRPVETVVHGVVRSVLDTTEHGHDRTGLRAQRRPPRLARSVRSIATSTGVMPYLAALDAVLLLIAVSVAAGDAALLTRPGDAALPFAAVVLDLLLLAGGGLYWPRLTLSALDELPALVGRLLVGGSCTAAVAILVLDRPEAASEVLEAAVWGGVLVVLGRAVAYQMVRTARRGGAVRHRAVVLGAGEVGGRLARTLLEHPEYGLEPVGFVDDDPLLPAHQRPVPLVGSVASLADVVVRLEAGVVLLAYSQLNGRDLVGVVRTCDRLNCEIFFVPRLFELHFRSREMDAVWGIPLVRLRRPAFRRGARISKRLLDVTVSALALVLVAPVMALCALAVRVTSGAPVIFGQERVGLDGRTFRLVKFRSYAPVDVLDAQDRWSIAGDMCLTPVGRFLRRTSLDELPQLWNVLRGDMTLVGPRPERPLFVRQFTGVYPHYLARHRVPAGLTGWAQVHGLRGDTSIADRSAFDNYYIENYSVWNDVKILLRTAAALTRNAR